MRVLRPAAGRPRRSVTLIELIVVIVIIGLLAADAIVGYNSVRNNAARKSTEAAAQQTASVLQAASGLAGAAVGGVSGTGVSALRLGGQPLPAEVAADVFAALGGRTLIVTATGATIVGEGVASVPRSCVLTFPASPGAVVAISCYYGVVQVTVTGAASGTGTHIGGADYRVVSASNEGDGV